MKNKRSKYYRNLQDIKRIHLKLTQSYPVCKWDIHQAYTPLMAHRREMCGPLSRWRTIPHIQIETMTGWWFQPTPLKMME